MNRVNGFKNIVITNSNRAPFGKSDGSYSVLMFFVSLVLAFLFSYITVMTIKYLKTNCIEKNSWFRYVFRFCYKDVCKPPKYHTINNIKFEGKAPPGALPDFKPPTPAPKDNIPLANYSSTVRSSNSNPAIEFDVAKLAEKPQVFHLANQDYTYQQAKCKCASYNAKLANYSQIVDAYNKGAEWCSYGWTEGQAAYYPTQKCNWLKKTPEERKACGKPGINGGFFGDPNLKFGINCYGKKPKGKIAKIQDKDCSYCEVQPDPGANKKLETDQILPFNDKQWSQ